MTSRRMRAAGLLAAAALGVTACGSDEATDATPSSSATSESASPSEETSAEETPAQETTSEDTTSPESEEEGSDDAPAAELTKPGTELKLGETAVIPQGDDGATLELTVTEVTKGSSADLSQLKDADKYKGYTPVYVQYTMTGTDSSADLGGDVLDDVDPITSDGRKASTLVIIGTSPFAKCDRNSVPDDFGPGDTETTCDVAMVQGGQEVSGAQYSPYDGDYADDGAIVWTK
ncbi:hypothetical protein [Janibacter sp. YB324]|nr:hypothetical protein [Janibacter sp. YB324]QNF93750.1 hypothetical protein H7A72_13495 [Janibacter sp. YB324]